MNYEKDLISYLDICGIYISHFTLISPADTVALQNSVSMCTAHFETECTTSFTTPSCRFIKSSQQIYIPFSFSTSTFLTYHWPHFNIIHLPTILWSLNGLLSTQSILWK